MNAFNVYFSFRSFAEELALALRCLLTISCGLLTNTSTVLQQTLTKQ